MELPLELILSISRYLSITDKCSLIAACRSFQQTLYKDSVWLDFALKNLLRGLAIDEIIELVFLKADQERLLKSRISKIQNFIKNKFEATTDISAVIAKASREPASVVTIGELEGIPWREWPDFNFAVNFVALFCRPETLNLMNTYEKSTLNMLFNLRGKSIKHISVKGTGLAQWDFTRQFPNLESAKLPECVDTDDPYPNLPVTLTKLSVWSEKINFTRLTRLQSFKQNRSSTSDTATVNSLIIKSRGAQLKTLQLPALTETNVEELAAHCTSLQSFGTYDRLSTNIFTGLVAIAKHSNEFPRTLKLGQKFNRKKSPPEMTDADVFFKDFGFRLKKLILHDLPFSVIPHLVHASNLVKLDLIINDPKSQVDGEANVKLPHVIAQLAHLDELVLKLAGTHQFILEHSHLTKLSIGAQDVVINIPSLVDLTIQRDTVNVVVDKCTLRHFAILSFNLQIFNLNAVSWSALESLTIGRDCYNYWHFVDTYLSRDIPINLKSIDFHSSDPFFRFTKHKSLMPKRVRYEWDLHMDTEDYVVPYDLALFGAPQSGLNGYRTLVNRFSSVECLDFVHCNDMTTEILDILCSGKSLFPLIKSKYIRISLIQTQKGLPNLKQIGFTESRDVNAAFNHLKLHSKSLELIYLYHIHSVETSDIQCPNLRTITLDNAGRYHFLNDVTDTNFCESTLQQLGETNACPNLINYVAWPTQTHPDGIGDEVKDPSKPVRLTKIPSGLTVLSLYLNSNLIAVDVESEALRSCSVTSCYHLKSVKLKADVHSFDVSGTPLEHLTLDSKLLRDLNITIARLPFVELLTPNLQGLLICEPASDHFLDHLQQLEKLSIYASSSYVISKTLFTKLLKCCPKLQVLEWNEKCLGVSASSLVGLKKAYKEQHGTALSLCGPKDLLEAVDKLDTLHKLPEKKQRMLKINALMKRTINNWKQKPKAKAFRSWRDYALREKKEKEKK